MIKIGAFGYGFAAILGAGAILLAVLGNPNWGIVLSVAVVLWLFSTLLRKFG